jgi:hypothetical protein
MAGDQHRRVHRAGAELVDRRAGRQLEQRGEVGRFELERPDQPQRRRPPAGRTMVWDEPLV